MSEDPEDTDPSVDRADSVEQEPQMADLFEELQDLEETVDSPEEREAVRETMRMAVAVQQPGVFGRIVVGFDSEDAAQAFLGAILFGIPMFVEGGTYDVGAFAAAHPLSLVGTHVFALGMIVGILYVADIQDVRIRDPILGIVPRRLVGVVGISLGTALLVMTLWGQIDWSQPVVAFSQASIAYIPMAIGAALGDILPG